MRQRTINSGGGTFGAAAPEAPKPIFAMDGRTFYSRIWFIEGKGCDWMGAVHRQVDSDRWELTYRFRYHAGTASPLDDEKSIAKADFKPGTTEAEAIAVVKAAADALVASGYMSGPTHELVIGSADLEVLRRALAREQFTNFMTLPDGKVISRAEVEAEGRRRKGAS